jgi:aquaporin Z
VILSLKRYAAEGLGLGIFMFFACVCVVLLEHPRSSGLAAFPDPLVRRALMGLAMGLTAVINVYSPWGKLSGAHINPAVSLTFVALGKLELKHLPGYAIGQTVGGTLGVVAAWALTGDRLADPLTHFAVTAPGPEGVGVAFVAEVLISAGMMTMALLVSQSRFRHLTGLGAGILVALYITFEAPLSGMSMNPARTIASAVIANDYGSLWLYFVAPILGMGSAAAIVTALRSPAR